LGARGNRTPKQDDGPWYDEDKVDDYTLALLYLVVGERLEGHGAAAWKTFNWETMNRLHAKGLIGNPVNKNKSVMLTEDAYKKSEELFHRFVGKGDVQ
jgi:hypothetical protein